MLEDSVKDRPWYKGVLKSDLSGVCLKKLDQSPIAFRLGNGEQCVLALKLAIHWRKYAILVRCFVILYSKH